MLLLPPIVDATKRKERKKKKKCEHPNTHTLMARNTNIKEALWVRKSCCCQTIRHPSQKLQAVFGIRYELNASWCCCCKTNPGYVQVENISRLFFSCSQKPVLQNLDWQQHWQFGQQAPRSTANMLRSWQRAKNRNNIHCSSSSPAIKERFFLCDVHCHSYTTIRPYSFLPSSSSFGATVVGWMLSPLHPKYSKKYLWPESKIQQIMAFELNWSPKMQ